MLPEAIFLTFAYLIPDIIPTLLQLYVITTTKARGQRNSRFIEQLYEEAAEDHEMRDTDLYE
jgi:hypothetical protein